MNKFVTTIVLILASASSARRKLLEQASIPFESMVSGVDEDEIHHADPKILVQLLAEAKARAISRKLFDTEGRQSWPRGIKFVLGCDSMFEFQGEILGKPRDKNIAISRLEKLSGGSGVLHTGHALLFVRDFLAQQKQDNKIFLEKDVVSTRIKFVEISRTEILEYVKSGEPLNCAGGFSLDGRGSVFIKSLNGCYSNVIGLSMPWLRRAILYANNQVDIC